MKFHKAGAIVGGAVMAVVGLGAAPASAACSDYFLCVYQYNSYDGGQLFTSQSNSNWDYLGNPNAFRFMNDKGSSAKNTTGRTYARIYQHDSYSGDTICLTPGRNYPDFPEYIDNKSSSHRFLSSC